MSNKTKVIVLVKLSNHRGTLYIMLYRNYIKNLKYETEKKYKNNEACKIFYLD